MLRDFLEAYEKGYVDGLRRAQAILWPDTLSPDREATGKDKPEVVSRPAYSAGFSEGLKDGSEIVDDVKRNRLKRSS